MKKTAIALTTVITTIFLASGAGAQGVWLAVQGGIGTYAMDDLNEDIGIVNDAVGQTILDEVEGGGAFGFALGWDASPRWALGIGFERLTGRSRFENALQEFEFDAEADLYYGFARYSLTQDDGYGLGAGLRVGSLNPRGDYIQKSILGRDFEAAVTGSALLVSPYLWGEYALASSVWLGLEAGYAFAETGDVEYDGREPSGVSIMPEALDYGGVSARLSLRFLLPEGEAPTRPDEEPVRAPKPPSEMVDPTGAIGLGGFVMGGIPLWSYSSDHDAGIGGGGGLEYFLNDRMAFGVDGGFIKQGRGIFPDDEILHVMGTAKYLFRPDLSSHYAKAGVGWMDYDYGEKPGQSFAAFELGIGYQWRVRPGLGLFAEAMGVTWAVDGGGGPLLEVRAGATLLIGD